MVGPSQAGVGSSTGGEAVSAGGNVAAIGGATVGKGVEVGGIFGSEESVGVGEIVATTGAKVGVAAGGASPLELQPTVASINSTINATMPNTVSATSRKFFMVN